MTILDDIPGFIDTTHDLSLVHNNFSSAVFFAVVVVFARTQHDMDYMHPHTAWRVLIV
jgi:hypothetical protein